MFCKVLETDCKVLYSLLHISIGEAVRGDTPQLVTCGLILFPGVHYAEPHATSPSTFLFIRVPQSRLLRWLH